MSRRQQQGYGRPRGKWWDGGDSSGTWQRAGRGRGGSKGACHGVGRGRIAEPEIDDDHHFVVQSPGLYQGGACTLEPPCVLGSFSVDEEKNVHFDDSMMAVLSRKYIPRGDLCLHVELDLNRSWHRVNGYTGSTVETFKQFLQWILKNQKKLSAEDSSNKLTADFVCTRGILKSIMQVPYARQESSEIIILAQYFKGSVYMVYQYDDKEALRSKEKSSLLEIYGHKFEQYMTGGDPDEVLECNCQYRCVLKLHLNELSLLYPTATDAIDQTRHQHNFKDMSSFVILKACKERPKPFQQTIYRKYILSGWWIETQLSGIPRLLTGTRNDDGVVHTLQMLQAADLPDQAEGEWEPSVCINVLIKFLNFVKEKVVSEPHKVHCFERSASTINYIRHSHETSVTDILPKWYREQLFVSNKENRD